MSSEELIVGGIWNSPSEASNFLSSLISLNSASSDALIQLAAIEPYDYKTPASPEVAVLFLTAVAKHLPAAIAEAQIPRIPSDQPPLTQLIPTLADLAGRAATICHPRSIITKSGIVYALANVQSSTLSIANVEFLQCCLLAGQYRFASRVIAEDWPRPEKGTPLVLILRYFYLRGMIHLGCDDFHGAIRCFWTVLSVPFDVASSIAVDAWKKMVLTKCLILQDSVPFQALVSLPAGASAAVVRILTSASPVESTATDTSSRLGVAVYTDLAKASHSGDRKEFGRILNDNLELLVTDHNRGLAERVFSDLEYRYIRHMASIYKVMPLAQLSKELNKPDNDTLSILAKVDGLRIQQKNEMICLDEIDDNESLATEDLVRLMQLTERIRKLDVDLAGSQRYQTIKVETGRPPRGVDDF
mmetsp:Transcript_18171/g.20978  ORF Transcript_18171/g.20978 Transcript_18171/m.20978 type:complete len:416 (-) Transcript_18171:291-1538(-)|eukprot:CAMPEP_0194140356 /NCGR_PEP_ID=MMETSP0152-20130528/9907_1 /TAXON_ID=1049557 /ORGANISM="Thalassiothrix antarctica, Strain L6-D1" /LENGTH=415 /DNA_ID=CAMNT_0038838569 /DNA_START=55 /DNA_END=1302 /DNA_ORIENTATION=+